MQGGAGPPRRAVRCLSSVSLLSMEDTGQGSTHDWGLAKQAGRCRLAHAGGGLACGRLFCFGPASQPLLTEAVSPGCAGLMPAGAQPRPASCLVQETGLTMTGQC